MKTLNITLCTGLTALLIGGAGCAINPGSSPDFGASVQTMQEQQTRYPNASNVPPADAVKPISGDVAARVLENHRESAARREDNVATQITINAGQ